MTSNERDEFIARIEAMENKVRAMQQGLVELINDVRDAALAVPTERNPTPSAPAPSNPYGAAPAPGGSNPYNFGPTPTMTPEDVARAAGQRVVEAAMTQIGKRYQLGATGPDAWDCSSLTQWAYRQIGVQIPRTTFDQIKVGREVSFAEAVDGDLIFSNFSARGPEHVSINISGPNDVIEAGNPVGVYPFRNRGRVVVRRYV